VNNKPVNSTKASNSLGAPYHADVGVIALWGRLAELIAHALCDWLGPEHVERFEQIPFCDRPYHRSLLYDDAQKDSLFSNE
jgi:hypothetical protein